MSWASIQVETVHSDAHQTYHTCMHNYQLDQLEGRTPTVLNNGYYPLCPVTQCKSLAKLNSSF